MIIKWNHLGGRVKIRYFVLKVVNEKHVCDI